MDSQNQNAQNNPQGAGNNSTAPAQDNTLLMSVLSYIGILVIIPLLMAKDNPAVKFHIKQGCVLLAIEIVVWAVSAVFWMLAPIWMLVNLGLLVLSIIGIVNAVQKQEKPLPIVGSYSRYFTF